MSSSHLLRAALGSMRGVFRGGLQMNRCEVLRKTKVEGLSWSTDIYATSRLTWNAPAVLDVLWMLLRKDHRGSLAMNL